MRIKKHWKNCKQQKFTFLERKGTAVSVQMHVNYVLLGICSSNCCCKFFFVLTSSSKLHLNLSFVAKKAFPSPDLDISGDDEPDSDGTPELMDVLVDTLLSLLPQSSAPMRSAIEQVFKYFCDCVTDDGLLRMLRVIKKDL